MTNERAAVVILLVMFVCRGLVASAIVPPWQAPDEPTHFALAAELALPAAVRQTAEARFLPDKSSLTDTVTSNIQRQVIESMAHHQWWEPYGRSTPDPLPMLFVEAGAISAGRLDQPLYYGLAALVLRLGGAADIEHAYWNLRLLSIALALTALVLGWAGTRLLFGPGVAVGAMAIAALHPQFLLSAISVNPDALVNAWGAFIWWQAARVMTDRQRALSLILLVIGAAAALLTKRSAAPLTLLALCFAASLFVSHAWRMDRRQLLVGVAWLVGVIAAGLLLTDIESRLVAIVSSTFVMRWPIEQATPRIMLEYLRVAIDYAWLEAGWQRFSAPEPWLWVARALTLAGAAGAALCAIRAPRQLRGRLLLAWAFVIVQVAAIVGPGFWSLAAPQGRYLFVVLAPMTALLWVGIERVCPARWRTYAGPALIGTLAIMDATGFATVLVPAYVPAILYVP